VTAWETEIGEYLCVAVQAPDGELHGTLSCVSQASERDARLVRMIAEAVAAYLSREGHAAAADDPELLFILDLRPGQEDYWRGEDEDWLPVPS
jgi:hypothetical protein